VSVAQRASVCYIVGRFYSTGHSAHLPRFIEEMAKHVDVHVVLWSHEDVPEFPGAASVTVLKDEAPGRVRRLFKLIALVRRLRSSGCRVFFVRIHYNLGSVLGLLRKPLGIRVYVWRSGLHTATRPRLSLKPGQLRERAMWIFRERVLFKLSTMLINKLVTGPESMLRYYHDEHGVPARKIVALDNDVDVRELRSHVGDASRASAREALGLAADDEVLLYVGGVSPRKLGPEGRSTFAIADAVLTARPRAHLLLVGPQSLPDLLARIDAAPWHDRVHLPGTLPFADVVPYYVASDLCVFPVYESGFPRIVLESMALGVPFVAFDPGGLRDLANEEQGEYVLPVGENTRFAELVGVLLDDPEQRAHLTAIGNARVQRYSTEAVAQDFVMKFVTTQ
jgi:glycosyltransferase involved in cell wall biosynthesis